MALSLGSPPPAVNRHRVSVEPGLSSPRDEAKSGHPAVWRGIIEAVDAPKSNRGADGSQRRDTVSRLGIGIAVAAGGAEMALKRRDHLGGTRV